MQRKLGDVSGNLADVGGFQLKSSENGLKLSGVRGDNWGSPAQIMHKLRESNWNQVENTGNGGKWAEFKWNEVKILQKLGDSSRNQVKMGENELKISGLGGVWQTIPINSEDLHSKTGKQATRSFQNPSHFEEQKRNLFWGLFCQFRNFLSQFLEFWGSQAQKWNSIKFQVARWKNANMYEKTSLLDVCSMFCSTLLDVCSTFSPWNFLEFYFFWQFETAKIEKNKQKKNQKLQKRGPKQDFICFLEGFGVWRDLVDHFVSSFFAFKRFSAKIHGIHWTCLPRFTNFCIVWAGFPPLST